MQPAPTSDGFIATNVDKDYPDGSNTALTLQANEVFQLPVGVWNLFCHVDDSSAGGANGHLSLMGVMSGNDDLILFHTAGRQNASALGGSTYNLSVPLLRTDGTEYFYLRFRKSSSRSAQYAYFLLLEKLQ